VRAGVAALDIRSYEGATLEKLGELSQALLQLLFAARNLASRLTDLSGATLDRAQHADVTRHWSCALDVADAAFVMRLELSQKQQELEAARGSTLVFGICQRCQQDLAEFLLALQTLIQGDYAQVPRERGVEASLKSRRAYAYLRRGVAEVGDGARGREGIQRALRSTGTLIAALVGSDGYTYFRASDRLQITTFQRRILEYLEDGGSAGRGLRVLQDFKLFVEQLAVINLRQDLKTHDEACLTSWLAELEGVAVGGADLVSSLNKYRDAVQGRDEALDAVLDGTATLSRRSLITDLRRLLDSLSPEAGSPENAALSSANTRTRS
jgi:hypothetical protein